ncbi:MAG TPA: HD domain-containing protein [Candidatus Saccharibacteria bacterium]|jgi:putative hydrolase of HD superfamily|nr:HD domain-containing protein [Candidatus Saccharibacteria bacterium]HMT55407.1 HD domain-containing protein [Candidatus Saccharibacteria bacterium]
MTQKLTKQFVDSTVELGEMLIQFARVNRAIYVDMEGTKESDTDHTVMLAVMACAIADSLELDMDMGLVAQYALIHDLVEVYAGDVSTLDFHNTDFDAKEANERRALERIKAKFDGTFPWIARTIESYESLADTESRYIKTLDKVMPAITHLFSDARIVDEGFNDPVAFVRSIRARDASMRESYAAEHEIIMQLRAIILEPTIENKFKKHGREYKKHEL